MLLLLRSAHDHAYLHLCAGCGRGKHISGDRRSVHGEGDDAFFCMMGILYGDAVDCAAVAALDGIACPSRGNAGGDSKTVQRGLHAENGLRDADERPGCRAGEPAVLALAEGGRVQNGPVARLAEVGVCSGNEPQWVVVKAAAYSQVALLGQGTDTGRAAAVSILLFLVTVPATALSVYFSALTAYGIHAYDFKLKKAAWGFILAVMMVPTQVFAIGYYKFMIQLKLIDTYWPLIIPAITTPVVVFFMYFLLSRYIVEGVSLGSVKG